MIDLLLDCAIFNHVEAGRENYHQICGIPVSDLDYRSAHTVVVDSANASEKRLPQGGAARGPSEVTFVRSRMLYARAALNARGLVHFGLRHIRRLSHQPLVEPPRLTPV